MRADHSPVVASAAEGSRVVADRIVEGHRKPWEVVEEGSSPIEPGRQSLGHPLRVNKQRF